MIKLNCEADGNPVPNITWTRKVKYCIVILLTIKFLFIYYLLRLGEIFMKLLRLNLKRK